ncbi:PTS glucitol/sorbitol transporter subunit IIA [Lacticaseibacillus sp. GG6-2]
MEITATVTAIGSQALVADDPLVILFDESATVALRDIAVVQQFVSATNQAAMVLAVGDQLMIDATTYTIAYVGQLANTNLQTIGHVSLIFAPVPAQPLANALYLTPTVKPKLAVGSQLTYITAD